MPVRLSFSTLNLLHSCERKFQLAKLLNNTQRETSEHLSFGAGFGAGIASYLTNQDAELALYEAWLAYWPIIETEKKNEARMFVALERAFFVLDTLLQDYELVFFEGRPACELSFRLDIDPTYYFVGYIDAVLKHRYTGQYVVFEVKTTGLLLKDLTPLYKHSGQALGYSICLDRIVGKELSSYGVLYMVAQLGKEQSDVTIHLMPFNKTLLDRLNWFIVLGLDVKHLKEMEQLQIYPRRGDSCLKYNKPCPQFGTCHLHSLDRPKEEEEDLTEYQFVYDLDALIQDHLRRLQEDPRLGDPIEGECTVVVTSSTEALAMGDIDSQMQSEAVASSVGDSSVGQSVQPTRIKALAPPLPATALMPSSPAPKLSLKEILAAKKKEPQAKPVIIEDEDPLTALLNRL